MHAALRVLALVLLCSSCVPLDSGDTPAGLTIENGTDQVIITVPGRAGTTLTEALAQGLPVPPIEPGQTQVRGLEQQNESGEWCNPGNYWVLQPNVSVDGQARSDELTVEDVTVLEAFIDNACFGPDPSAYYLVDG